MTINMDRLERSISRHIMHLNIMYVVRCHGGQDQHLTSRERIGAPALQKKSRNPAVFSALNSYDSLTQSTSAVWQRGVIMDEHYQHGNGGDGAARVQEFASDAPGSDAKEPRQSDQGSAVTFEAKAEEIGKN